MECENLNAVLKIPGGVAATTADISREVPLFTCDVIDDVLGAVK